MFSKKKDLDAYVAEIFKKSKSEKERNAKCLTIAKQYSQLQEWATARRYVGAYIQDHPNSAPAMRLQGECEQNLGQKERALNSFRSSLTCDPTQKDLTFKVCELLCNVSVDTETYQYWADRAEAIDSSHPSVFKLKEHILTSTSATSGGSLVSLELEALIMAEQKARPHDPSPNCRLLKLYIDKAQYTKAHALAIQLETGCPFRNDISWYETLTSTLEACNKKVDEDWDTHTFKLLALERLLSLYLDEVLGADKQNRPLSTYSNMNVVVETAFKLDQALFEAQKLTCHGSSSRRILAETLLKHLVAQFGFHLVCILYKKAKKDSSLWKSNIKFSGPLLMLAWQTLTPDDDAAWLKDLPESLLDSTQVWLNEGKLRRSQAGHILLGLNAKRKLMDIVSPLLVTKWQEKLYEAVFSSYANELKTSYLATSLDSNKLTRSLPTINELWSHDESSLLQYFNQLPLVIWYGLQFRAIGHPWTPLSEANDDPNIVALDVLPKRPLCPAFHNLKKYNKDFPGISQATPESLSQMDIDAFIFAIVTCASGIMEENQQRWSNDRPEVLPVTLSDALCTPAQISWWTSICHILKPSAANYSVTPELRKLIRSGLEAIRSVDSQSGQQDVRLLCSLARFFTAQATKCQESDGDKQLITALFLRASHYWSCAKPVLESVKSGRATRPLHIDRLFCLPGKDLDKSAAESLLYEACFADGMQLVRNGRYEEAIEAFGDLTSPYASMEQAMLFKKMGDAEKSDMSAKEIYYKRSRDSFFVTLDRLKGTNVDQRHPLNASLRSHIEEVEEQINALFPDAHIKNPVHRGDILSDASDEEDFVHTPRIFNRLRGQSSTPFTSSRARPVTLSNGTPVNGGQRLQTQYRSPSLMTPRPREEARPSPERLEAQMRQLSVQRESELQTMARIVEATRSNDSGLKDELLFIKDAMREMSRDLQRVESNQKEMIEARREQQESNKNLKDMHSDIQKILRLLKSTRITNISPVVSEPRNIPDEDLYLYGEEGENEYCTDGAAGTQTQQPKQQFPSTASAPASYPALYNPALYQFRAPPPNFFPLAPGVDTAALMYQNLAYYAPGALPFSEGQRLPEFQVATPHLLAGQLPIGNQGLTPAFNQIVAPPTISNITPAKPPQVHPDLTPAQNSLQESAIIQMTPHAFQINMPPEAQIPTASPLDKAPAVPAVSPQSILQNVPSPVYSSVTPETQKRTSRVSRVSVGSVVSEDGEVPEHDAIPDFKPIIPLPDEIVPTTGEEGENLLFENRAKLYRYIDGEWKERGTGALKILESPINKKVRILMRRDQVLKVCCNHFIPKDLILSHISGNDKTWSWAAQDFADEKVRVEKFGVRFKTVDDANLFKDVIERAKKTMPDTPSSKPSTPADTPKTPLLSASGTSPILETPKSSNANKLPTPASTLSFGGFTFSTSPTIAKKGEEAKTETPKKEDTPAKPGPFASFSFGAPKSSTTSLFGQTTTQSSGTSSISSAPVSFGNTNTLLNSPLAQLSFSSLPQNTTSFTTGHSTFKGFDGAGSRVFGVTTPAKSTTPAASGTPANPTATESPGGEAETAEDFVPTADFQPVIPLPELIEVKTGEEGEEVLFECRAKLLRFVSESKEWKERGIGKMKMTWNPTSCKVRLIMRREQVLKVCCNHFLLRDMKLVPISSSDRSWTWIAQDYSEGSIEKETFAIKFKNPEEAASFKEKWLEIQKDMVDGDQLLRGGQQPTAPAKTKEDKPKPLSELFKPATGNWECKNCYVSNKANTNTCVACCSSKEGAAAEITKVTTSQPSTADKDLMKQFKKPEGSWECKFCYVTNKSDAVTCVACESARPGTEGNEKPTAPAIKKITPGLTFDFQSSGSASKFSFGNAAAATVSTSVSTGPTSTFTFGGVKPTTPAVTTFAFGGPQPSFAFGTQGTQNSTADSTKTLFGGSTLPKFGFNLPTPSTPASTVTSGSITSPGGAEDSDGEVENDEGDHIHFTPIIPLPDAVEVVTGEEDEETLYSHRAKLYRWANGEWKERGLGDIKILRHKEQGHIRILMRREQVLKICLNHRLYKETTFTPKGDTGRSFQWYAADYSEGEYKQEQFAILFKTEDIAKDFIEHIESAKTLLGLENQSMAAQASSPAQVSTLSAADTSAVSSNLDTSIASSTQFTPSNSISFALGNDPSAAVTPQSGSFLSGSTFSSAVKGNLFEDSPSENTDDEVHIVEVIEPKVSDEDVQKARALKLPDNFYAYKQRSACKGCRGCENEDSDASSTTEKDQTVSSTVPSTFSTPLFGSVSFGAAAKPEKLVSSGNSLATTNMFATASNQPTFASLANSTSNAGFSNLTSSSPSFSWAGAGTPVFGSKGSPALGSKGSTPAPVFGSAKPSPVFGTPQALFSSPSLQSTASPKNNTEGGSSEDEGGEETHDPHFEPIIALPDMIEVKTGEEDEEKMFSHRAKLYRYDSNTREWKERGVGEMKLLYHQATGRYRLLLRREQVHKVVLNQLLTKDLEMKPMKLTNNALLWGGFNHAEEGEGKMEELAVKFKNQELVDEFKAKVEEAKERLASMETKPAPVVTTPPVVEPEKVLKGPTTPTFVPPANEEDTDEEEEEEEEEDDEEDYETYDDYEETEVMDERGTVFARKDGNPVGPWLGLGVGHIKMVYASDGLYSVVVELDVSEGSENVRIPIDTRMNAQSEKTQDKEVCFSGMNQAQDTDRVEYYKVLFPTSSSAEEFQANFMEGLAMADNLQQDENDAEP
ncbi:E3 SUMO-protein ligase RanBP2-like [Neocloeon triangulifer]|uniref:E3 SUMO-protein ligase RanBP2-like n=1 Tax=Neocloeon triangulifer TaxID=2078957 RepID=UPI00286F1871|nr:E3 SUMO-protein ligase RanBP2-like [Neocloeon triangulifer]